jgi:multicomponent Na+:H+ antiporter subunit G
MSDVNAILHDAGIVASIVLTIVGVVTMTIGIIGMLRMPDVYTKIHAAGKGVFLGVVSLCFAAMFAAGDDRIQTRTLLIAGFLILTAPVASHVIAQSARIAGDPMHAPDAIDESGVVAPTE